MLFEFLLLRFVELSFYVSPGPRFPRLEVNIVPFVWLKQVGDFCQTNYKIPTIVTAKED